jgi:hypothetical protein
MILILCLIINTTFHLRHINKLKLKYSVFLDFMHCLVLWEHVLENGSVAISCRQYRRWRTGTCRVKYLEESALINGPNLQIHHLLKYGQNQMQFENPLTVMKFWWLVLWLLIQRMELHGDTLVIVWEVNIRITGNTSCSHKKWRNLLRGEGSDTVCYKILTFSTCDLSDLKLKKDFK